ncbi:MAG: redoxin domain-containing protein [Candidatus Hydrogenedens sp.]|nr:redoxin domain-containing protein [Candidatus Hydrogenedentota bacterium]NLF57842.1 redoxin domain-containing protein [Candidatus Hydrogenedens sp.]
MDEPDTIGELGEPGGPAGPAVVIPPQTAPAAAPPPEQADMLALMGMVFGICGFCMGVIPLAVFPSLVGFIISVVCLTKKRPGRGMALSGAVFGGMGLLAATAMLVLIGSWVIMLRSEMAAMMDEEDWSLWEGAPAPEFTVTDVDGQAFTLGEMRGRPVVVDRFATWCAPCDKLSKHLDRLVKENPGIVVLSISDEPEEMVRKHAEKKKTAYRTASAEDLPDPFGDVSAYPTLFFMDPDGVITAVVSGYMDYDTLKEKALEKHGEAEKEEGGDKTVEEG